MAAVSLSRAMSVARRFGIAVDPGSSPLEKAEPGSPQSNTHPGGISVTVDRSSPATCKNPKKKDLDKRLCLVFTTHIMNTDFGARVRSLRESRRFGLREFASMVKMSPTYLSKVERGLFAPPSEGKIRLIAKALSQNEDEFLALAGRVSSDLPEIIRRQPRAMATFLRAADGLTAADIERMTQSVERERGEK